MTTILREKPGLGTGIYTFGEAAWLLSVSPRQVYGWASGYVYVRQGRETKKAAVLQGPRSELSLLTFHDLIELFFVREYRQSGVDLQKIRDASTLLSKELKTPYPFACEELQTDGWQLLRQVNSHYVSASNSQRVFDFAKMFFKEINFGEDCLALNWWPIGKDRLIVIDPHRSFGAPIEVRSGIRADILYNAYKAEGETKAVADWYEVPEEAVRAAIDFRDQWLQKAA